MPSRIEKYYIDNTNQTSSSIPTRSSRNSRLYKEVYGKYGDLDNLPIEDNTDEIDMEKLRELVLNDKSKKEKVQYPENLNVLEKRKRNIDEQKIYDINKILEKAKYENSKLKEPINPSHKVNNRILSTLESSEISCEEIKAASKKYEQKFIDKQKEQELSMTREIKYQDKHQEVENNPLIEQVMPTNDLSLDLFSDLKPTENTITTKPIRNTTEIKPSSNDTSDIDIIKKKEPEENDFFTSSYEFSKKDFADDDDFYDTGKSGGIIKIILLILSIIVFIGVIVYFVSTYGLGM